MWAICLCLVISAGLEPMLVRIHPFSCGAISSMLHLGLKKKKTQTSVTACYLQGQGQVPRWNSTTSPELDPACLSSVASLWFPHMLTSIFCVQVPVPHPRPAPNSPNSVLWPPVMLPHPFPYPDEDNAVLSSGNSLSLFLVSY